MITSPAPARHAFTLIELSVVLVVIGLLVGGIMGGQYLVRQAEIQGTITDLTKYKSAYVQFRETYGMKPGDLTDAQDYWGADTNCTTTFTATDRVLKKTTCNGDGDNLIEAYENFRAWQHMADADLIDGAYTGVPGSGGAYHAVPDQNVPAGRLSGSAYYMDTYGPITNGADTVYNLLAKATDGLYFGTQTATNWPTGPVFTPRQQYQIDSKIDDGKPTTGNMFAFKSGTNPNCVTGTDYALTEGGVNCSFVYFIEN